MVAGYPTMTAAHVKGGTLKAEDIMTARITPEDSATHRCVDDAACEAWDKRGELQAVLRCNIRGVYADGFRAGAAWARRQATNEPSSQAVGTSSKYQPATEEPEDEA